MQCAMTQDFYHSDEIPQNAGSWSINVRLWYGHQLDPNCWFFVVEFQEAKRYLGTSLNVRYSKILRYSYGGCSTASMGGAAARL